MITTLELVRSVSDIDVERNCVDPITPTPPFGDEQAADKPTGSAETTPAPRRGSPIHPWVLVAAGGIAIIGSFLPWANVTAPFVGTMTVSGVDGSDGWITAALGLVVAVYGGLLVRGQRLPVVAPVLSALAALALVGVGVWKVADVSSSAAKLRSSMAASTKDDVFGIGKAMSDAVHISVGSGLWLLTLGGVVACVVMAVTLVHRYQDRAVSA